VSGLRHQRVVGPPTADRRHRSTIVVDPSLQPGEGDLGGLTGRTIMLAVRSPYGY
jgi:hypothetical protein